MGEQSSAFDPEDRKTLKQLFTVIGIFVVCTVALAIIVNLVM